MALSGNWRDGLMNGSWRGVPFLCRDTGNPAGRRLAPFEFPDSDTNYTQDLGRGIKIYRLEVYVCGDDYMAQRDALETALDDKGSGTLVHPYKGELQVYAAYPCELKELSLKGRAAYFECSFIEKGGDEPPVAEADTSGEAVTAGQAAQPDIASAFAGTLKPVATPGAPPVSTGGFSAVRGGTGDTQIPSGA